MEGLFDKWQVGGFVTETRTLTSEKNKSWRLHLIKVAGLGKTFEMQTDVDRIFASVVEGQHVVCSGDFDFNANMVKLVVRDIKDYSEVEKKKAS